MKYFLTCALGLALFVAPVLAQKNQSKSRGVRETPVPVNPKVEPATTTKKIEGTPKLTIESFLYNFGKVKDTGDLISHVFEVKNQGTAELKIESVAPG